MGDRATVGLSGFDPGGARCLKPCALSGREEDSRIVLRAMDDMQDDNFVRFNPVKDQMMTMYASTNPLHFIAWHQGKALGYIGKCKAFCPEFPNIADRTVGIVSRNIITNRFEITLCFGRDRNNHSDERANA